MPSATLLIATNNTGKLAEFRSLLRCLTDGKFGQVTLVAPADLSIDLDVAETLSTYDGNAATKACAFHQAAIPLLPPSSTLVTLADDSGLEVEVLNNAPGPFSHRFGSSPGKSPLDDAGRRAFLLLQLRGHPQPWHASFHCSLAVFHAGRLNLTHGRCRGTIIDQERGTNGFGYDPIFLLDELDKTMAELDMCQKNSLSHRARAVLAAIPVLEDILST